ncbi:MAG: MlaD family protein [Candidatus Omnitrophota bacterium]
MKMSNEIKTGIIVVAAMAVVVLFYSRTTDSRAGKVYRIKTSFNYAEGVKQDAVVKLAGIEVGRVEKIEFQYAPETKIEMVMTISDKARIHEDSIAFIAISGMIGDAYVGITAGSSDRPFVKDGGAIASEDPVEARKLWKQAEGISQNLDKMLVEVRGLTENVNGVVKDNAAKIDAIAGNLEQTAVNFKDFSSDIKKHPWKLLMKGKE